MDDMGKLWLTRGFDLGAVEDDDLFGADSHSLRGNYTGLVPAPLNLDGDKKYELTISMTGPAATEGATPEELKQYGLD